MKSVLSFRARALTFALGCFALSGVVAQAATILWTNTASGSWNTAVNWDPNAVPGTNDTAVITSPGVTVSLADPASAGAIILGTNGTGTVTLSLAGQALTLNGPLTVNANGSFTVDSGVVFGFPTAVLSGTIGWSAGALSGTLTLAAGGTLNLTTPIDHDLNGTVLTNNGTVVWNDGRLRVGSGTAIYNYGLWVALNDQTMGDDFGGSAVFYNYGTFRKAGGASEFATSTTFGNLVAFNQLAGVLDVQNGTNGLAVSFNGGGNFTGGYITTNQFGLTLLGANNFNLNGTTTGTNTWENAGNLVGTNVINGVLTWLGGTWDNDTVTIPVNSQVLVVGTGNLDFNGSVITNYGTFAWSNGRIRVGSGTSIYNYGLWDAQNDQTVGDDFAGGAEFNNYGTFRKSGGASEFSSSTTFGAGVAFNQLAGLLEVENGTNGLAVNFQGGGAFTGGFISTNQFGLTVLDGGNFNLNGTITGTNTWQQAGNLSGTNVVNGVLMWLGGSWDNDVVTIPTNSQVWVVGTGNVDLNSTVLTNYGTLTWSDGHIRCGNGTAICNYGLWDAQSDLVLGDDLGGSSVFNNFGTFRKSGGAGEFTNATFIGNGVAFNQLAGVIDVQNGTNGLELAFQGGANLTGGYITTNQFGLTVLSAGNFNLNGTVTGTNTWEDAGLLAGTNVIRGAFTWLAGNWNSSAFVTVATNSTLIVAGGTGNNLDLNGVVVTNSGTVRWSSGRLRGGNGTTINNLGVWNAQSDDVLTNAFGGIATVFNNPGTFTKTAGTNNGTGSRIQSGVTFNNSGRLDCQAGVINLLGAYSLANGTLNFGINSLTNYGEIDLAGAAPLVGTISANLNNGYIPIAGNSFTNLYYGSCAGKFANTVLPFADAWKTNYAPTHYVITVLNARPVLPILPTNTFVVNELTLLVITNTASDGDVPPQTLTYTQVGGTTGMTLNPTTGVFTWTPQQTNSPSTNLVSLVVTDNGSPPLSATNTLTIIVNEVNVPPSLPAISTQTVKELTLLTVTNTATESNIHSTLTYNLVNPPAGMTISSGGIITWTPSNAQTSTTNAIVTAVTNSNPYDLVNPHLGATNTFTVIVLPALQLSHSVWLGGGQFQFTLNDTTINENYIVQYSTNLETWIPSQTNIGTGGPINVIEPSPGNSPYRFYRVQYIP